MAQVPEFMLGKDVPKCRRVSISFMKSLKRCNQLAVIAQSAEHFLGKEEVTRSNRVNSSIVPENFFEFSGTIFIYPD